MAARDVDAACSDCGVGGNAVFSGGAKMCRLRDVPDGVRTHVRCVSGCGHLRSRLYSLGILPGTEIFVYGHGDVGCRVEVRDTCVVIDAESADSILCDTATGQPE